MRARTNAQLALELWISQLFIGVDIRLLNFELVVHNHSGTCRQAKPGDAAVVSSFGSQIVGNGFFEQFGFDRQKQAIDFGSPQPGSIDQQDDIGGRRCALRLQARQNASVI